MKVTLDTSILVRANARANGPARALFVMIQAGAPELMLSRIMLEELNRVIRYPRVLKLCSSRGIRVMTDIELLHLLRSQP